MTTAESSVEVRAPDSGARTAARALVDAAVRVRGSRGRLDALAIWGAGVQRRCPPAAFEMPVLLLLTRASSDASSDGVGRERADTTSSSDVVAELARLHGVTRRTMVIADSTSSAFESGCTAADHLVDAGADLIIPVLADADASETAAAAIIALFTRVDASAVMEFAPGADDAAWMSRCAEVRDTMRAGRAFMGDPLAVLSGIDAGPLAFLTGVLLQSAARATPVLLDGTASCAAAVTASRMARQATAWWVASSDSGHRARVRGLEHLEIPAVTDLGILDDSGVGALAALPVLQAAMVSLRD